MRTFEWFHLKCGGWIYDLIMDFSSLPCYIIFSRRAKHCMTSAALLTSSVAFKQRGSCILPEFTIVDYTNLTQVSAAVGFIDDPLRFDYVIVHLSCKRTVTWTMSFGEWSVPLSMKKLFFTLPSTFLPITGTQ